MKTISVEISKLMINPAINPRHSTGMTVEDLKAQIKANGFHQPLWVRPSPTSGEDMEVIDGQRRLLALRELGGYSHVPCIAFMVNDAEARELALAANVIRQDLSPADEAEAYYRLKLSGMGEGEIRIGSHGALEMVAVAIRGRQNAVDTGDVGVTGCCRRGGDRQSVSVVLQGFLRSAASVMARHTIRFREDPCPVN